MALNRVARNMSSCRLLIIRSCDYKISPLLKLTYCTKSLEGFLTHETPKQ
jgi:hypothetical protein